MFEEITKNDLDSRAMARVSSTPSRRTAFGESKMSAEDLKNRFDRLPRYLAGRLNEIFRAINTGELSEALKVDCNGVIISLDDLVTRLLSGNVDFVKIQTLLETISLTTLAEKTLKIENSIKTGELAEHMIMKDGESFDTFYENAKIFVNRDHEAIVNKVLERFVDVSEEGQ